MNIFNDLIKYAGKWSVKSSRNFNSEEKSCIVDAEVVVSNFGLSVKFTLDDGTFSFIPLSKSSALTEGEKVDMEKALLVTLCKPGEKDINRVEI